MVALYGRDWKLSPSLAALVQEADNLAPNRSTASDGSIGDASHQARPSDHNPSDDPTDADRTRWVTAVDLTDDDAGGMNARALVDHLVRVRDKRIKYLIHEGTIWRSYAKPGIPAWTPTRYTGPNGHFSHAHVSIYNTASARNDLSSWFDTTVPEGDEVDQQDKDEIVLRTIEGVISYFNERPLVESNNRTARILWDWYDKTVKPTGNWANLLEHYATDSDEFAEKLALKLRGTGSVVTVETVADALRKIRDEQ